MYVTIFISKQLLFFETLMNMTGLGSLGFFLLFLRKKLFGEMQKVSDPFL